MGRGRGRNRKIIYFQCLLYNFVQEIAWFGEKLSSADSSFEFELPPPHSQFYILLNLNLLGSYLKLGRSKITSISAFRNKLFKLYRTTIWQAVWVNLCRKFIVLLADVQDWLHYGLRNRSWVSFPGCDHQTRPPLSHCQSQASSNLEPSSSSSPFVYWNRQKLHFS